MHKACLLLDFGFLARAAAISDHGPPVAREATKCGLWLV
jgi:hypothetical protein